MRVTKEWYEQYLQRQAAAAAARPAVDRAADTREDAKPQPASSYGSLVKEIREKAHASRCFISIESRRRKLVDPRANLYGGSKFFEDALMYSGAIHDDTDQFSEGVVTQTKIGKEEEEMTIIRIWKLDDPVSR